MVLCRIRFLLRVVVVVIVAQHGEANLCLIALNSDPEFALNSDPLPY
jgi:hypothetical protein